MFARYLSWVYRGVLDLEVAPTDECTRRRTYKLHIKLYQLADVLLDSALKVMDSLVDALTLPPWSPCSVPDVSLVRQAYRGTAVGSALRKLLVDKCVARFCRDDFEQQVDEYPEDFVKDVAVKAMRAAPLVTNQSLKDSKSDYHQPAGEASK